MGVAASAARSQLKKPLKYYNVEERAMKVISRDKPKPAPPHPAMKKVMEGIVRDPSKLQSSRTDPVLLKNLSSVHIKSTGDNPVITAKPKLPEDRSNPFDNIYGYEDPATVPPGKASLRQILEILSKISPDTENFSAEQIVEEYKIDMVDAMNLVQYYRTLIILKPPPLPPKPPKNPLRRLQQGIDNLKN